MEKFISRQSSNGPRSSHFTGICEISKTAKPNLNFAFSGEPIRLEALKLVAIHSHAVGAYDWVFYTDIIYNVRIIGRNE